jgi:(p)ppGpp synthase/HD superfamily hydrolase
MFTERLDRTMRIAARSHDGQMRKGSNTPYIVHPVGVMMIASEVTDDPDILDACLLHDVIEDVPEEVYSRADMLRDFGHRVVSIVEAVSKDDSLPDWRERQSSYIEQIRGADIAAVIVSAADKIHNLLAIMTDYKELGEDLWSRFHAGRDDQLWYYEQMLEVFKERIPESKLTAELIILVDEFKDLVEKAVEAPRAERPA